MAGGSNYDVIIHDISYELSIKKLKFNDEDKKDPERLTQLSLVMNDTKEELDETINKTYLKTISDNGIVDIPKELKTSIAQNVLEQVTLNGLSTISEIKIDTELTNQILFDLLSEEELSKIENIHNHQPRVTDREISQMFEASKQNENVNQNNSQKYSKMIQRITQNRSKTNNEKIDDMIEEIQRSTEDVEKIENFEQLNKEAERDQKTRYRFLTILNAITLIDSKINYFDRDVVGIDIRAQNVEVVADLYYLLGQNPNDKEISDLFNKIVEKGFPNCIDSKTGKIDIEKLKIEYTQKSMGKKLDGLVNPEKKYEGNYKAFEDLDDAKIEMVIGRGKEYIDKIIDSIANNQLEIDSITSEPNPSERKRKNDYRINHYEEYITEAINDLAQNADSILIDSMLRSLDEQLESFSLEENMALSPKSTNLPAYIQSIEGISKILFNELIRANNGERDDFVDDEYTKENKKNIYENIVKLYGKKIPVDIMELMYKADPNLCEEIYGIKDISDIKNSQFVYTKDEENETIKNRKSKAISISFEHEWDERLNDKLNKNYENFMILVQKYPIEALRFLNSKNSDDLNLVTSDTYLDLYNKVLLQISHEKLKENISQEELDENEDLFNTALENIENYTKQDGKVPFHIAYRIGKLQPELVRRKYNAIDYELKDSDKITTVNTLAIPKMKVNEIANMLVNATKNPNFKKENLDLLIRVSFEHMTDKLKNIPTNKKEELINSSSIEKIKEAYEIILRNTPKSKLESTIFKMVDSDRDMFFLPDVIENIGTEKDIIEKFNKAIDIRKNISLNAKNKTRIESFEELSQKTGNTEKIKALTINNPMLAMGYLKKCFEKKEFMENPNANDLEVYTGILEGLTFSSNKTFGFQNFDEKDRKDFMEKALQFKKSGQYRKYIYNLDSNLFKEVAPDLYKENIGMYVNTEYFSSNDVGNESPEIMFVRGRLTAITKKSYSDRTETIDKIFESLASQEQTTNKMLEYKKEYMSFIKDLVLSAELKDIEKIATQVHSITTDKNVSNELIETMCKCYNDDRLNLKKKNKALKFTEIMTELNKEEKNIDVQSQVEPKKVKESQSKEDDGYPDL